MSALVFAAVIFGMSIGMTRAVLVKLLGAVRAFELMTLAGNTHEASDHQNQ